MIYRYKSVANFQRKRNQKNKQKLDGAEDCPFVRPTKRRK